MSRATNELGRASDTPRLDAELLMAEALHIDRDKLILSPPQRDVPKRFGEMLERRKAGEPVAYITGRRAFWNIELHVGPGVLIPRPDSEVLIASAIEHFEGTDGPQRILDLGTGPGTLLLAALDLWPELDRHRRRRVADGHVLCRGQRPAARLRGPRVKLKEGDWAKGLKERFDLVLCNPPYVAEDAELGPGVREFEPDEALFAGKDGLDAYRELAPQLPGLLNPGGLAAIEIGHDQGDAVTELLARDGLQARVAEDLGGRPRAVLLTWV